MPERPLIAITSDTSDERVHLRWPYIRAVEAAGGVPVILPCVPALAPHYVRACHGILLSGGDDPRMEHWGVATHPQATPVHPDRQAFELALLEALRLRRDRPVLGVCLGMQMMALHAGGRLDQHLPETLPTADNHWGSRMHSVEGAIGCGQVLSHHRQAISDPGSLHVVARAPDGVIEAVRDDGRPFYLGVQWHPERTGEGALGEGMIRALVEAAERAFT